MAEAKINFETQITLVPMLVQPGDTVVIPLDRRATMAEIDQMTKELTRAMPGVKWGFVEGSPMRHALVYRPH